MLLCEGRNGFEVEVFDHELREVEECDLVEQLVELLLVLWNDEHDDRRLLSVVGELNGGILLDFIGLFCSPSVL